MENLFPPQKSLKNTDPGTIEKFPILHQPKMGLEAPLISKKLAEKLKKDLASK